MHTHKPSGGWRRQRGPAGLIAAATSLLALAIPAIASAHPQVYSLTPKKQNDASCTYQAHPDGSCLEDGSVRYAVANDGYAMTYTETSGSNNPGRGIVNYQLIPGGFRKWEAAPGVSEQMSGQQILEFAEDHGAVTNVQAHATCDLPALDATAAILAWQGSDPAKTEPFFDYVPWQKKSAGLGDEPDRWIPVVEEETGVDLSTLPSDSAATKEVNEEAEAAKALCEGAPLNGTYYKADTGSNPANNAIADAVAEETAPLAAEVDSLLAERSSLQSQIDAWAAKGAALEGEKDSLWSQVASLRGRLGASRKANAGKAKTIRQLRLQLRRAKSHG